MATDPNSSSRIQRGTYQGLAEGMGMPDEEDGEDAEGQIISGTVDAEFFVRAHA
jgi:hypothetical protein